MTYKIPWYHRGSTQKGGNPFSSFGLEYCTRCKTEVDTDTEAEHTDNTYVYRKRCLRCGHWVKYGVFKDVPLISGGDLPPVALAWCMEPGKDRR